MSLASSMKNLVDDIHSSKTERHAFVKDMSKDVKVLLARFNKEQDDLVKELKEMSAEVKKILATEGLINKGRRGRHRFYVSDNPEWFSQLAQSFLGRKIENVKKVNGV